MTCSVSYSMIGIHNFFFATEPAVNDCRAFVNSPHCDSVRIIDAIRSFAPACAPTLTHFLREMSHSSQIIRSSLRHERGLREFGAAGASPPHSRPGAVSEYQFCIH